MATSTNSPRFILIIGRLIPPSPELTKIQSAVDSALTLANSSGKYAAEYYTVDPSDPDHITSLAYTVSQKTWDGVLIGWGIRGVQERNELFEGIINVVVQGQRPVPRLLFSLGPNDILQALERNFGGRIDR